MCSSLRLQVFVKNTAWGVVHIVLFVAFGWGTRKGIDVIANLANMLDASYKLVVVGSDNKVDEILPSNVISIHKTQDQRQLAEIYTAADVFANPTREEVLGMVNVESLACGTPVVTFKTGGSPECIDSSCGYVVEANDIYAMRDAIKKVCAEKPFSADDCIARANKFRGDDKFGEYIKLYEQMSR